jgi:hypothetical protein
MTTNFYAYIHCKPDGVPFYVGKGRGKRSHYFHERNPYYTEIQKKYGTPLVAVLPCSSETTAFELEKGLIKCLRRSGVVLCNMTDGGEGAAGHRVSEAGRKCMSNAATARNTDPEYRKKISEGVKKLYSDPEYRSHQRAIRSSAEFAANISSKLQGHVVSDEARKKMSASKTGRRLSAETKAKMSAARMGHPTSEATKAKIGAKARARHLQKTQLH